MTQLHPEGRYRDLLDWSLIQCRDCSTRTTVVAIRADELTEHDAWHVEAAR